MADHSYPKIEIYTETDLGDPNAGNKKWTLANGQTVYSGAADHRPFIKQTTITLNDEQKKELLATTLTFQPHFKEQKPILTLAHYFELRQAADRSEFRKLLPANLQGLYNQKEQEHYRFFSTLVLYQKTRPHQVPVVWLNANEYYVNEVYYHAAFDPFIETGERKETILMEGALDDYLRLSAWFQNKLSEGFEELIPEGEKPVIPKTDLIFSYQLTPGMVNTGYYHYELRANGQLQGDDKQTTLSSDEVSELLLRALHLDWKNYEQQSSGTSESSANDKQVTLLTIWNEGRTYRLVDPYFGSSGSPLLHFRDFALNLIQGKLNSKE